MARCLSGSSVNSSRRFNNKGRQPSCSLRCRESVVRWLIRISSLFFKTSVILGACCALIVTVQISGTIPSATFCISALSRFAHSLSLRWAKRKNSLSKGAVNRARIFKVRITLCCITWFMSAASNILLLRRVFWRATV